FFILFFLLFVFLLQCNAGHRRVENRPIFRPKIKSADFRIVSGRFGRPFFRYFGRFCFSVKLEKNRPILPIGRCSRQLVGKSADFLPIKNLRMSS
ncbi:unnamed protein product, partial [Staurois parvus]